MRHGLLIALLASMLLVVVAPSRYAEAKVGVGDELPDLKLTSWDGQPVSLAGLRGKVVVIDFWASWCVACRDALPALDALSRRFASGSVVVVGINIDQTAAMADRFLHDHLPTPHLQLWRDPQADALARFGAAGMPALYVVDPHGVVRFVDSGYAPERLAAVEEIVARYLPQAADSRAEPAAARDD